MGYAYDREQDRFQAGCIQTDLKKIINVNKDFMIENFAEFGFQVFSQWNEDGLIQYLIQNIPIENKKFIEFGVQNYEESNTKFLLMHDSWEGLVLDSSKDNINYIKNCNLYWKYGIRAVSAFITKKNINDLLTFHGMKGDIGLLSIDIDGNDFYVWDAINCVQPRIVICEVNPYFGKYERLVIPYKEDFFRTDAHYSNLYYGASLSAIVYLAEKKGYKFVCINSAGTNAFFVRNDIMHNLKEIQVEDAYKIPQYKESRGENGNLTHLSYMMGLKLIKDMELLDLQTGNIKKIGECQFYHEYMKRYEGNRSGDF